MKRRLTVIALAVVLVAGALTVWRVASSGVDLEPAPSADDPACTRLTDRAPDRLAGLSRDDTGTPGAASWGDGDITLRCGTTPPDPTTDPCLAIGKVDWVLRESASQDGEKQLVTYGRKPAVEIVVADGAPRVDTVLHDLSALAEPLPRNARCS